jgi:hypothetical protein
VPIAYGAATVLGMTVHGDAPLATRRPISGTLITLCGATNRALLTSLEVIRAWWPRVVRTGGRRHFAHQSQGFRPPNLPGPSNVSATTSIASINGWFRPLER